MCGRLSSISITSAASSSKSWRPPGGCGLGSKPRRYMYASVQRLLRSSSPDHVVAGLAPPCTSRTSGPMPSRITAIGAVSGLKSIDRSRVRTVPYQRRIGIALLSTGEHFSRQPGLRTRLSSPTDARPRRWREPTDEAVPVFVDQALLRLRCPKQHERQTLRALRDLARASRGGDGDDREAAAAADEALAGCGQPDLERPRGPGA